MTGGRFGFALPLLLVTAFRATIDELHDRLAERGHPDARPIHGFALQAIGPDGITVSGLGRRLAVSKQAAAKTVASLERLGYIERHRHPTDSRAVLVRPSLRGQEFLSLSAEIFDQLHVGWAQQLGEQRLSALEDDLELLAGSARLVDIPGWIG